MKQLLLSLFFCANFFAYSQQTAQLDTLVPQFGQALADSLMNEYPQPFSDHLDFYALGDRILDAANAISDFEEDMPRELMRGMLISQIKGSFPLDGEMLNMIQNGGEYVFLKSEFKNGSYYIIMRMSTVETAFAYHTILLNTSNPQKIKIIDINTSISGEYISKSAGFFAAVGFSENSTLTELQDQIQKLKNAQDLQYTDPKGALSMMESISSPLNLTSVYETIYNDILGSAYPERVRDKALYVADSVPDATLHQAQVALSYLVMAGDTTRTNRLIGVIENFVGPDPYLLIFKGEACRNAGDLQKSIEYDLMARDAEQNYFITTFLVSVSYIELRDFKNACKYFEEILVYTGMMPMELEMIYEEYPSFTKSTAYSKWRAQFMEEYYPNATSK